MKLFNKSKQPYICKSGKLLPGSSLSVTEKEAELLLKYKGVCKSEDMGKEEPKEDPKGKSKGKK